jgi:hypothetical protein
LPNHSLGTLHSHGAYHNGGVMKTQQLHTLTMIARHFQRYGLSADWFKAEAKAGRIPHYNTGRKLLFDPEAVERALLERARQGSGKAVDRD